MGKGITAGLIVVVLIVALASYYLSQKVEVAIVKGWITVMGGSKSVLSLCQVGGAISHHEDANVIVKNISRLEYARNHGRPRITASKPEDIGVVNLTIKFTLITPTNHTISFEPLKIGKGGTHNFTLVIGPDEGLTSGRFRIVIEFFLQVTTPAGITIWRISITIVRSFEVP